jgi:hypothetical protein
VTGIRVEEVGGRRGLARFLDVPRRLHPPGSPWVAPLDYERRRFFDPRRNAFFERGSIRLFVASDRAGRAVGRVAAIDNPAHNEFQQTRLGFFGFFEAPDDPELAGALLEEAARCARERGHGGLHGPVNPSTNHPCGLLVEGYEDPPALEMPWNPPYYERLLRDTGFAPVREMVSVRHAIHGAIPERLARAKAVQQKRHGFTVRELDLRRFREELAIFKTVYNEAWSANYGFVPLSERELEDLARDFRPLIDPKLCHIAEVGGEPAGVSLSLPDFNQALKPLRGRLLPFGWLRLLRGLKRISRMRGMVLGVRARFRGLGIDHALLHDGLAGAIANGYRAIEIGWVLADNEPMLRALQRAECVIAKRYRLYERELAP